MSVREEELIARIRRGDDLADVRKWFLDRLAAETPMWSDLGKFEQAFVIRWRDHEKGTGKLN